MRRYALRLWAAASLALLGLAPVVEAAAAPSEALAPQPGLAAEEKEACTRNMKVIYDAIQAYQFDHKDLPNWLSDLVPDYLTDGNVLICPVCRRTGRSELPPLADPKLACSYIFEFSPAPVGTSVSAEPRHTRREWKRRQMGLVGSVVPLVRCRNHDPVLNLGFNGTVYESAAQWELMFTNRVRAAELSIRAIFGIEAAEDQTPTPLPSPTNRRPIERSSAPVRQIDLSRFYTSNLADSWQGNPGDDLASLPIGVGTFGGIEFDVHGVVQLKGKASALAKFPAQIKGIPVHQRCQHLYFLHAASLEGHAAEGEQIGSYLIHLPNNQMTLEIPVYYGKSVRNWHQEANEPQADKELKVAWTGENAASKASGRPVRLFVTAWNLAPGVEIDSLDFVSAERNAAPFLLAVSFD